MNKIIVITATLCMATTLCLAAEPKPQTKAQFLKSSQKNAAKSGKKFDAKSVGKHFDKLDTNEDGLLSYKEKVAGRDKAKARQKELDAK